MSDGVLPLLKVLTCIGFEHDLRLVAGAALVCLLASCLAFWLFRRGLASRSIAGLGWFAFGGLAAGSGIWATHFIAMLAFQPALKSGYHPFGTILSLVIGVVAAGLGFALAARLIGRWGSIIGGAVLGGGIGVMHFTGMASFETQGMLIWNPAYVTASIVIGIGLAIASLFAAGREPDLKRGAAGTGLLVLAIVGMHFTAMAAVSILPDPLAKVPAALADRPQMALMICVVALIVLTCAAGITAIESRNRHGALSKLRVATDAMPAALAFFDSDDRLVVWNSLYEKIIPGGRTALRAGMTFDELLGGMGVPEGFLEQEKVRRRDGLSAVHEFAKDFWIRIENVPTGDGGMVTVGIDVSSLKRDQDALKVALDQAEAGSRAKSEFLANMSHEIRTPLNGVVGVADILSGTALDERQAGLVEVIRSSARQVDAMLGDILDLSSMEAGTSVTATAPFPLATSIREATLSHRALAESKGIEFVLDLEPALEATVVGDAGRMRQILDVLIGNAVKFTDHGRVMVEGLKLDDERYRISVSDSGPGFDPAHKERLFEQFTQSDGSATRRHGGAGLGLALARRSAQLLGAVLDCGSAPGEGSTFTLEIPLLRPKAAEAAAPDDLSGLAASIAAGEAAPTVLIVDDHATNRHVLELILGQLGVRHVSVENGREAVDACGQQAFDAILMDIQMPVMDGITATREIRRLEASEARRSTPVIIVSANCLPDHVVAGRDAGAQKHLSKPINAEALIEALNEVMGPRSRKAA